MIFMYGEKVLYDKKVALDICCYVQHVWMGSSVVLFRRKDYHKQYYFKVMLQFVFVKLC